MEGKGVNVEGSKYGLESLLVYRRADGLQVIFLILILTLFFPASGICKDRNAFVEKRLIDFISGYYSQKNDIQITLNNQPSVLKDENVNVRTINFSRLPDSNGYGICAVELEDKRRQIKNVFVAFRVMHKKKVYVLKEAMKRGEIITEDRVTPREVILNDYKRGYPSEAEDVVGKQLKRDLNAGTAITKDMMEDYFVIKRSDIVVITMEHKRLVVRAKGRAIERGRIGDVIKVKNLTSQKEVLGRVTGSGIVNVGM